MEAKLTIAGCIAWLAYFISGFFFLLFLVGLIAGRGITNWSAVGQIFMLFCAGLFFDLLAEIGWRVHYMVKPHEVEYDPRD